MRRRKCLLHCAGLNKGRLLTLTFNEAREGDALRLDMGVVLGAHGSVSNAKFMKVDDVEYLVIGEVTPPPSPL